MCEWGSTVPVLVFIPARLSRTGKDRWDTKPVDKCLAPLVTVLNDNGYHTVASCCAHGKGLGSIALIDGRELIIAPDYDTARAVFKAFPMSGYISES